jgi:DNA-binding GntR family transcriptional regulator
MNESLKIEQPPSLAELVVRKVREAILTGEFALGEKIGEEAIAAACGVSRTPVRDALMQLQLQGLVTVVPKKGSFVFEPDETDIAAICDYRLMLETHAATLLHRANKKVIRADFDAALGAMGTALERDDPIAFHRSDTTFHLVLIDHCGNYYVREAYARAIGRLTALRTNLAAPAMTFLRGSLADHERIAELTVAGDHEKLDAVLRVHIGRTREVYVAALRKRLAKPDAITTRPVAHSL